MAMKVLVEVACFNASDIVGTAINALMQQTLSVGEVLVVDNASTDGTAELTYPKFVTVLRNPLNLGICGAVVTGLEYARTHGYSWLWVLDADSRPRPYAFELLTRLVNARGPGAAREIGVVASSNYLVNLGKFDYGRVLTPGGPRLPRLLKDCDYVECDSVIWSGALINLAVVEQVGLPRVGTHGHWEDFSQDYGDTEYSYRIRNAGYAILVHRNSVIDHHLGREAHRRILGHDYYAADHPAFRRYLHFRNLVFFWLRIYRRRNWPMLLVWFGYRMSAMFAEILFLERDLGPKIKACLFGIRDGLRGRLDGKFEASA